ncbi:hypothetical protein [Ureibacillus chungkukjangi]|nr:hypothetical protein [Ureibacillus chungkukjangi]
MEKNSVNLEALNLEELKLEELNLEDLDLEITLDFQLVEIGRT